MRDDAMEVEAENRTEQRPFDANEKGKTKEGEILSLGKKIKKMASSSGQQ